MKRLGIGFTAIIAMLAMSFTFASKAGVLTKGLAKASVIQGCYTSLALMVRDNNVPPLTWLTIVDYRDAPSFWGYNPEPFSICNLVTIIGQPEEGIYVEDPLSDCLYVWPLPFCCYEVNDTNEIVAIWYGELAI